MYLAVCSKTALDFRVNCTNYIEWISTDYKSKSNFKLLDVNGLKDSNLCVLVILC